MEPCTFQPKLKKSTWRTFLMLQETKTSTKAFYIFSEKAVLIFKETSYFSGGNFQSSKNEKATLKNFLYIRKRNFSTPSLKKFLYIRKEL